MMKYETLPAPSRKGRGDIEILYNVIATAGNQARLHGRSALIPDVDLTDFRCEAVFDWVKLSFHLEEPSDYKSVRQVIRYAIGRRCWVEPIKGSEGCGFEIPVQEPSIKELQKIERAIEKWRTLSKPVTIIGAEISVDFYPTEYDHDRLAALTAIVMRHHLPSREVEVRERERPRFSWGHGKFESRHVFPYSSSRKTLTPYLLDSHAFDNQRLMQPSYDSTLYAGKEHGDVHWRIMMKEIDKQDRSKGTAFVLPDNMKRVRIEVTQSEMELRSCGIETVSDLNPSNLQRMQGRYFQFKLPTIKTQECPKGRYSVCIQISREHSSQEVSHKRSGRPQADGPAAARIGNAKPEACRGQAGEKVEAS